MTKSKLCPWCGAVPELQETFTRLLSGAMKRKYIVQCPKCGCFTGLEVESRRRAYKIWNTWVEERAAMEARKDG